MICTQCHEDKSEEFFYYKKSKGRHESSCKACCIERQKNYYNKNRDKVIEYKRKYDCDNKDKLSEYHSDYRDKNRNDIYLKNKAYYNSNKSKIVSQHGQYNKDKRASDPLFRLRCNISSQINNVISKDGKSCLKYLPYTTQDLKDHLESKFELWMNWTNYGKYSLELWDDCDDSTWTWQIDHIVPHSSFKYLSMEDDEFKRCWALENLRPLSAKENIIKGNRIFYEEIGRRL